MVTRGRLSVVLLSLVAAMTTAVVASESWRQGPEGSPSCWGRHWVGAWAAAPSNAGQPGTAATPLTAQTVRMAVRPTVGGDEVRVRLSHRYGDAPAHIGHATVAVRDVDAAARPGTVRSLRFDGEQGVRLEPGWDVVSDPVGLRVRAEQDLLVSLHVAGVVRRPTVHALTYETSYLSASGAGDHAADESGRAFPLETGAGVSPGWYFLSGVDVLAARRTGAVVAFGDSITDGFQAGGPDPDGDGEPDPYVRYTDFLADRIHARGGPPALAVLNSGISGNRVLADASTTRPYGEAALERFRADALRVPGATDLILMEGINDLATDQTLEADRLIDALSGLVRQAQLSGLTVHLGTLTPAGGARQGEGHGSTVTERRRQAVNRWIRTSGVADSVVDFDLALRDPADPSRLRPAYDSGDHLHPNTAGFRAMARAVPLDRLAGTGCP